MLLYRLFCHSNINGVNLKNPSLKQFFVLLFLRFAFCLFFRHFLRNDRDTSGSDCWPGKSRKSPVEIVGEISFSAPFDRVFNRSIDHWLSGTDKLSNFPSTAWGFPLQISRGIFRNSFESNEWLRLSPIIIPNKNGKQIIFVRVKVANILPTFCWVAIRVNKWSENIQALREREKRDFLSLLWRASETEGEVILSYKFSPVVVLGTYGGMVMVMSSWVRKGKFDSRHCAFKRGQRKRQTKEFGSHRHVEVGERET